MINAISTPLLKTTQKIWIALFVIVVNFNTNKVQAQVNVNVNIGSQAVWGPVGYDYVEYYYLPEADVFYYVPTHQFIYWNNGQQIFVNTLPASDNINLYSTYKVVVNKHKPYLNHGYYVSNYAKYKHKGSSQIIIRDSDDKRYFVVNGHPKHPHGNNKSMGNGGNGKREMKYENHREKSNGNFSHGDMKHERRQEGKHQGGGKGKHGR